MSLWVWAIPDDPGIENDPPSWVKVDLLDYGVLPYELWDKIDEEIDKRCREIDAQRRLDAAKRDPLMPTN